MCGDSQSERCQEWRIAALSPSSEQQIGQTLKQGAFGCISILAECAGFRIYLLASRAPWREEDIWNTIMVTLIIV